MNPTEEERRPQKGAKCGGAGDEGRLEKEQQEGDALRLRPMPLRRCFYEYQERFMTQATIAGGN